MVVDRAADAVLDQATIYLAEPDVQSIESLIRQPSGDAEPGDPGYEAVPLNPALGLDGVLLVQRYPPRPPDWVESLRPIAPSLPAIETRTAGAVLIVRLAGRVFALTFGQGRHLLNTDLLVDDFGLRVAANTVDQRRIRSVDGRTFERGGVMTRRQASRPGRVEALGMQVDRENYRAITGRSRREGEGRIHGSTSLGVTRRIELDQLQGLGQELLDAYAATEYREAFGSLDRMRPLRRNSAEVAQLDAALLDALRAPDLSPYLAPPTLLDWEHVSGFRLSTERGGPRYDDLDLRTYLLSLDTPVSLERLHDDEVRAVDRDSPRIVARWSIRRCLIWETTLDNSAFVLADGRWYNVDRAYLDWVNSTVATVEAADLNLPVPSIPNLDEGLYNREAADALGAVLLDTRRAHVPTERGGFELCDIFVPPNRLVHVKRGLGSQELTYLFAQGVQSAEGYRNAREVRERLQVLVAEQDAAAAAALPIHDRPERDDYVVVYAIVSDSPERVPMALPFFARASLARAVRSLRDLDFRIATIGVPTTTPP